MSNLLNRNLYGQRYGGYGYGGGYGGLYGGGYGGGYGAYGAYGPGPGIVNQPFIVVSLRTYVGSKTNKLYREIPLAEAETFDMFLLALGRYFPPSAVELFNRKKWTIFVDRAPISPSLWSTAVYNGAYVKLKITFEGIPLETSIHGPIGLPRIGGVGPYGIYPGPYGEPIAEEVVPRNLYGGNFRGPYGNNLDPYGRYQPIGPNGYYPTRYVR